MGSYKLHRERTRNRIYQAAQELFSEYGYDNTSLADIAERAEISTGTLYRYYPAKHYLLLYAADDALERMEAQVESFSDEMSCKDRVWSLMSKDMEECLAVFLPGETDPSETRRDEAKYGTHLVHRSAVYSSPDAFEYAYRNRAVMARRFEDIVASGIERGEVRPDVDAHDAADILVAVFFRQYDLALLDPTGEGSLESLERRVTTIFDLMAP